MQIIESTVFGVRSAFMKLNAGENGPTIFLFPMIHIADKSFYDVAIDRCEQCDLVLAEGVKGKSMSLLTSSYRYFAKNKKVGLVLQSDIMAGDKVAHFVNSDVSAEKFNQKWSNVSFVSKLTILSLSPLVGLYLRFFGTREMIAKHLSVEDLEGRDNLLDQDDHFAKFREVALHWRDQEFIKLLDGTLTKYQNQKENIGIVFGASHMRAIIRHLVNEKSYKITHAEWVDVIRL